MLLHALPIILFALGAATSPVIIRKSPVTLPLTRRLNLTHGFTLPELDKARAHALKNRFHVKTTNGDSVYPVPAVNTAVTYTTNVSIPQFAYRGTSQLTAGSGANRLASDDLYARAALTSQPPTEHTLIDTLLIDTGSANTWIGASTSYTETSTSQDTDQQVVSFFRPRFFCQISHQTRLWNMARDFSSVCSLSPAMNVQAYLILSI